MELWFSTRQGGKNEIISFIKKLPMKEKVDGYGALKALEDNDTTTYETKKIYKKAFEIKFYEHNRIIYTIKNDVVYLFHIFKKKTNKINSKEMTVIKERYNLLEGEKEYENRK